MRGEPLSASDENAHEAVRSSLPLPGVERWPALPIEEWEDTYHTLHRWTQIAGKVRLGLAPLQNHWWNAALYVNTRGLTTSPIPYRGEAFEIQFDFAAHRLEIQTSFGKSSSLDLAPKSVATFYGEFFSALRAAGIEISIDPRPQEVPEPVPFDQDETHRSYDPEYASRFWRILLSVQLVLEEFRAHFVGKASPVHFFWGNFDLAYTRFSGRMAPARKGVITSEAYSDECSSVGWWPGGGNVKGPAFYAYTAPEPPRYNQQNVKPAAAFYHDKFREYILMYDDVRRTRSPRDEILKFAQSAYEAGASLAGWDRAALERRTAP